MDGLERAKTLDVLALALMALSYIFRMPWLLGVAFLLLLGNIFETRLTDLLARSWMRLASLLGGINTRILLAIAFYLILTPISLLYRLANRDAADHFLRNRRPSYWERVSRSHEKSYFEKLW